MNDRILELAHQALGTRKHVPPVWQFYDDELTKFVLLIVQECGDVAAINQHQWESVDTFIKKHFGVQE